MTVSIIGAGNVAQQLGKALVTAGHRIHQIYNRNYHKASVLAEILNANAVTDLSQLDNGIDVIIIAISDDAISEVVQKLDKSHFKKVVVAHTSGSVSIDALSRLAKYGIFYPFQTITRNQEMTFSNIPLLISGNSVDTETRLTKLAKSVSTIVQNIKDEQRKIIHLSGVFANNFGNHMFTLASKILKTHDIPFEILIPLIEQTVSKLKAISPERGQTGPAIRRDYKTINTQIEILKSFPEYLEIYKILTRSIIRHDGEDTSSKNDNQRVN